MVELENNAMIKKGKATELSQKVADVLVRLRQKRHLSQREVAEHIGVSFQQYQKYEKAKDRLSLEKAILMCEKLSLPLTIFAVEEPVSGFAEEPQAVFGNALSDEERLVALFRSISRKSQKELLAQLELIAAGKN